MENFFTDNPDIQWHFEPPRSRRCRRFPGARLHRGGAVRRRAALLRRRARRLSLGAGDDGRHRAREKSPPLAPEVDRDGAHFENGQVTYAKGTERAMGILAKSEPHGHDAAAPVRRPELPRRALQHGHRNGGPGRRQPHEHLRPPGHRRDDLRIRRRPAEAALPAAVRQRQGDRRDDPHRARRRQRPAGRAPEGGGAAGRTAGSCSA